MADAQAGHPRDPAHAGGEPASEGPPPFWEWVVAGIGLVLLLAALGYLAWQQFGVARTPPDPTARVLRIEPQGGRFLLQVRVDNRGRAPAAALRLRAELLQGGAVVESSETEIPYLPGESSAQAGFWFTRDPRALTVRVDAASFHEP